MIQNITKVIWCTILIVSAACATTNQKRDNNDGDYSTGVIPTNFQLDSSSLADDIDILYRVKVHVDDENGTRQNAELTFQIRSGSNKIYLKSRSLSMTAGNKSFDWPGREWSNVYNSPPVMGIITTVKLEYSDLVTIANASEVTGNLAGQNFEWSYQNREPIRDLIEKIDTGILSEK